MTKIITTGNPTAIDWTIPEDAVLASIKKQASAASRTMDVEKLLSEFPWACHAGYLRVVKYLHYQGAKATSEGIDMASENGHLHVIKYLVDEGATVNGYYPLSRAIRRKRVELTKYLVKNGTDINNIAIKAHKYFALTCMFGTPTKSVKDLTPENEKYLPALLQRLFDIKKISPYDYLLTCPEWHKPVVMNIISS